MSLRILVICLFQLSALFCQELSNDADSKSPFLGDHQGQSPQTETRSGRTFGGLGFWNYGLSKGFYGDAPPFPADDYFPDESAVHRFNVPAPLKDGNLFPSGFPSLDNTGFPGELGRGSNQPWPFFYPQFPTFPQFPHQFPFQPLPPLQPNRPPAILGGPINVAEFAPWWKSDNVCVEKEETAEEWTPNEITNVGGRPDYSINLQSCVEQRSKYVCKTITNRGGKKLTVTETRECCRGFARFPRRDGPNANCVKVEVLSMDGAAAKYSFPAFADLLKQANISSADLQNSTLLLPLRLKSETAEAAANGTDLETQESILGEDVQEYFIPNRVVELEVVENEELIETQSGHKVRFNVYPRSDEQKAEYDYAYHYTANCVPILKPRIFTGEGTIIGLKEPLVVPEENLVDLIGGRDDLTMFNELLEKANLTEFLATDAITVLAPNNDAFAQLDDVERQALFMGDRCATEYLKNHLLGLTFCSSAVVKNAKAHVDNVLGKQMTFERQSNESDILVNRISTIVEADLLATNGLVHVMDAVLPGAPMTAISMLKQGDASIFAKLLQASKLTDRLEHLQNVTVFAPTDKALKDSNWNAELENNSTSLENNETLIRFLLNHISEGIISTRDFRTGLVPTKANELVKMNIVVATGPHRAATLQCSKLLKTDEVGCNSMVHLIDRALEVPSKTLLEALSSNKKYSKFYNLIKTANMTNLFGQKNTDLLVLVPTNDVFQEQKEYYEEILSNPSLLNTLVKTHIVPATICCSSFPEYPIINSLQNLNGMSLVITRQRRPSVANVDITKCDKLLKDGVIFEVNDLIEFKDNAANHRPIYY